MKRRQCQTCPLTVCARQVAYHPGVRLATCQKLVVPLLQQAPGHENELGRIGITPRILRLSNRQDEWSANNLAEYSLNRRCGALHGRFGRHGEQKNLCPSQQSSNNSPFVQPAAYSLY